MAHGGESQPSPEDRAPSHNAKKDYELYIADMVSQLLELSVLAGRKDIADSLSETLKLIRSKSGHQTE